MTHNPDDMYVFKVPVLRNVAVTAPYFHDDSVATLPEAVRMMARVQIGKSLAPAAVASIVAFVAFLASLTGKLSVDFTSAPVLPPPSSPQEIDPPPASRS